MSNPLDGLFWMQLHCKRCQVEWKADTPATPCWMCGEVGFQGVLRNSDGMLFTWNGQLQRVVDDDQEAAA